MKETIKISPIEIQTRRENLNLSIGDICHVLKIKGVTWEKWEQVAHAPYFLGVALRWVEEHIAEVRAELDAVKVKKKVGHSSARSRTLSFRGRFLAKTTRPTDSDCLLWTGANSIRLEAGGYASPRQAAWIVEHDEKPAGEIRLRCANGKCVNVAHFEIAASRNSGRRIVSDDLKNIILFELKRGGSVKHLAKKFEVSVGTVSGLHQKLLKEKNGDTEN